MFHKSYILSKLLFTTLILVSSLSVNAEMLEFQATFVIDGKTTFQDDATVIIPDPDFGNVKIGDSYVIDFIIDTERVDTDDSIEQSENVLVTKDNRNGNFGSLLTSVKMSAAHGNLGSFDPSGIGFSTSAVSHTDDEVVVYKADNAIANLELISMMTATSPSPTSLGGSLTDLAMNFRNIKALNLANPDDFLDDRSVSVDPFSFDALFAGPSSVAGNASDLVLLDDDILGSGFAVNNLDRPLSLRFGEAEVIPDQGVAFQESIYVWGTFSNLELMSEGSTEPVPLPSTIIPLLIFLVLTLGLFSVRRL